MQWARGDTLGEFVNNNYTNKPRLTNLLDSLNILSEFLPQNHVAHGDVQEGNLIVDDEGKSVVLIDYDGMFVPEIAQLGASEIGHRDYQHPRRNSTFFNEKLDQFSFIELNIALRALCIDSSVWRDSNSGAGVILFRANDLADPDNSSIFARLAAYPQLTRDVRAFAEICKRDFLKIPQLREFISGITPVPVIVDQSTAKSVANSPAQLLPYALVSNVFYQKAAYISQYPVLDAGDYYLYAGRVGQLVELVGRIVEIRKGKTRHGKPYVFINFAHWQGKCVKITLWSDALDGGGSQPDEKWVGRWVTVRGLVEPIYSNKRYGYEHISITPPLASMITELSQGEALYRLGRERPRTGIDDGNKNTVAGRHAGVTSNSSNYGSSNVHMPPSTANSAILIELYKQQAPSKIDITNAVNAATNNASGAGTSSPATHSIWTKNVIRAIIGVASLSLIAVWIQPAKRAPVSLPTPRLSETEKSSSIVGFPEPRPTLPEAAHPDVTSPSVGGLPADRLSRSVGNPEVVPPSEPPQDKGPTQTVPTAEPSQVLKPADRLPRPVGNPEVVPPSEPPQGRGPTQTVPTAEPSQVLKPANPSPQGEPDIIGKTTSQPNAATPPQEARIAPPVEGGTQAIPSFAWPRPPDETRQTGSVVAPVAPDQSNYPPADEGKSQIGPPLQLGPSGGSASSVATLDLSTQPGAAVAPAGATAAPPLDLLNRESAETVQNRLKTLGYFVGYPDGIWGPDSRSALKSFRRTQGLGGDDRWDSTTQSTLMSEQAALAGSKQPTEEAPGETHFLPPVGAKLNPLNRRDAIWIQRRLRDLGLYSGEGDGVWGMESRTALSEFKRQNGLPADEEWDAVTERRLRAVTPQPQPVQTHHGRQY
jgi:hypothetical protein